MTTVNEMIARIEAGLAKFGDTRVKQNQDGMWYYHTLGNTFSKRFKSEGAARKHMLKADDESRYWEARRLNGTHPHGRR